jgi:hypothetical protein
VNADLHERAVVDAAAMPWTPRAGADEKLLEDAGPRRTAIVRLPANGVWSCRARDLLVLDGELRERGRRHLAGTYVHDTADVRELASDTGCTLFVKSRPASRPSRRVVDARGLAFEPGIAPGLWEAPLLQDLDGVVGMLRFDPGTAVPLHRHDDGEEFFVLDGEVCDEFGTYAKHCWVRQPPGSSHAVTSPRGCVFFTFAHHLAHSSSV